MMGSNAADQHAFFVTYQKPLFLHSLSETDIGALAAKVYFPPIMSINILSVQNEFFDCLN